MIPTHPPNLLSLPITPLMMDTALAFATEQSTVEKRKQVFHNILAVQIVHSYMRILGNNSELEAGDSWNPLLRQFSDVADLKIGDLAHFECRPVLGGELKCVLPEDLPENRMGVIPVKLDCEEYQAQLLGFSPLVIPGAEIQLADLKSLDVLLDYIDSPSVTVQLRQWLEGFFALGWQSAETLIGSQRYSLAQGFMSAPIPLSVSTSGAKLIDLGMNVGNNSIVLFVGISSVAEDSVEIRVQLHPTQKDPHLPADLQLELLSDSGESLRCVTARQFDNLIQLPRFQCHQGEQFGILIRLNEAEITEVFVI